MKLPRRWHSHKNKEKWYRRQSLHVICDKTGDKWLLSALNSISLEQDSTVSMVSFVTIWTAFDSPSLLDWWSCCQHIPIFKIARLTVSLKHNHFKQQKRECQIQRIQLRRPHFHLNCLPSVEKEIISFYSQQLLGSNLLTGTFLSREVQRMWLLLSLWNPALHN